MILFILISICILIYTLFESDGLIYRIKKDIKNGCNVLRKVFSDIGAWFLYNIVLHEINLVICWFVSIFMMLVLCNTCPV